jgi:tRNA uridine 5-carbamoylmethylation protein Kti12
MNDVKYIYFGNQEESTRNGIISVGYCFVANELLYAVAFCSKADRFEKSITHKIITGRIKSGISSTAVIHNENMNYIAIRSYIISELKEYHSKFAMINVPSWTEEIVKGL